MQKVVSVRNKRQKWKNFTLSILSPRQHYSVQIRTTAAGVKATVTHQWCNLLAAGAGVEVFSGVVGEAEGVMG